MALKEARRKQQEKDRLAEEREKQIRHLTQLLQSGVCIHLDFGKLVLSLI